MTDPFRPLKDAFSRFGTGVTIASCLSREGAPVGLTVNSFTSVSLEPPLVQWCIAKRSALFDDFMAASHYGISVLGAEQRHLSTYYATPMQHAIDSQHLDHGYDGTPLLLERLAGFDCELVNAIEAGDHVILLAQIIAFDSREGAPLIYVNRAYQELK